MALDFSIETNFIGSNQRLNKSGFTILCKVSFAFVQISSVDAFILEDNSEFVEVLFTDCYGIKDGCCFWDIYYLNLEKKIIVKLV